MKALVIYGAGRARAGRGHRRRSRSRPRPRRRRPDRPRRTHPRVLHVAGEHQAGRDPPRRQRHRCANGHPGLDHWPPTGREHPPIRGLRHPRRHASTARLRSQGRHQDRPSARLHSDRPGELPRRRLRRPDVGDPGAVDEVEERDLAGAREQHEFPLRAPGPSHTDATAFEDAAVAEALGQADEQEALNCRLRRNRDLGRDVGHGVVRMVTRGIGVVIEPAPGGPEVPELVPPGGVSAACVVDAAEDRAGGQRVDSALGERVRELRCVGGRERAYLIENACAASAATGSAGLPAASHWAGVSSPSPRSG